MYRKLFFLLFCISAVYSCRTAPENAAPVLQSEGQDADQILITAEKNPVKALALAYTFFSENKESVKSSELYVQMFDKTAQLCVQSADEGKYFDAWKYAVSLKTVKLPNVELPSNIDDVLEKFKETNDAYLSGLKEVSRDTSVKLSQFIQGTVTIWVDLGVKVEKGRGFADRVIGSGFFIDKRGYIITNHHVISNHVDPQYEGFSRVYIKTANDSETRIPAKVVGWDSSLDLALLKAEIEPPYVFSIGSSQDLDIGDKIFAIGSPVGLDKTLTSGIVSAIDRRLFSVAPVMQIDAAVNNGNSGGPIIDQAGNVQAVVFAGMMQYEGLSFAIPVEYVSLILPRLFNGGNIAHSWIGAYGRTKKENPSSENGTGVDLLYTMAGGSSWNAHIPAGSVITSLADKPVSSIEQLQTLLLSVMPGIIVPITYMTEGSTELIKTCVYLDERPENPVETVYERETLSAMFYPVFGLELSSSSEFSKRKFVVTDVIKGSIADESGFSVHDPVEIMKTKILKEEQALYAEIYTKKRKAGYLDVSLYIASPLDSPFFF